MPEARPISESTATQDVDERAARLRDAARNVRAAAISLQGAVPELDLDAASPGPPGAAFAELRAAQNELARAAQRLMGNEPDSRTDLVQQIEALRANIGFRVRQIVSLCRRPATNPNETAAALRRAELTDAIRAVDRILERALQAMADVHRLERRAEAAPTRPKTRP